MTINFRRIEVGDYDKGFIGLLEQLSKVGNVSKDAFAKTVNERNKNPLHRTYVGEKDGKIVCSASLLIEPKFFRECKYTGHIEDVVVDKSMRKTGVGKMMITKLIEEARNNNCYNVILDCRDHNVGFYEKCGLHKHANEMVVYLE